MEVLVILWEWAEGPHKGATFCAVHSLESDGRIRDWPDNRLRALGAVKATVSAGDGLDLLISGAIDGH